MFKQKSDPASAALSPADAVQQARTRARQRLVGAVVLLGIGVIAFPIVFESQPRPIPVDIPIEIPKKDSMPPLVAPPRPAPTVTPGDVPGKDEMITESRTDSGRDVGAKPRAAASAAEPAASRSAAAAASARPASAAPASPVVGAAGALPERRVATPASSPAASPPEAKSDDGARARAILEGRPALAADAQQRFVVQVGAFADAEAARETRKKVERLGLKTYTQVAQTSSGSRIRVRVGPFASRDDAEAAQAKAKAAGVDAVVLTL